jgi:hypothetical protein
VRAVDCKLPFQAKITFRPRSRIGRDQRYEKRAGFDLPANRRIPGIPTAQLALVKPYFDACIPQRIAYRKTALPGPVTAPPPLRLS